MAGSGSFILASAGQTPPCRPYGRNPDNLKAMPRKLSRKLLRQMIEDATLDAYMDEEQVGGFCCLIDENLATPFDTKLLGVIVSVRKVDMTDGSDIVAVCQRGRERLRVPVLELPLPEPPPDGWEWIEAYRYWRRGD
jgi:hypothetical protein